MTDKLVCGVSTFGDTFDSVNGLIDNNRYVVNQIAYDVPVFIPEAKNLITVTKSAGTSSEIPSSTLVGDQDYTAYAMIGAQEGWRVEQAGFQRFFTPESGRVCMITRSFLYDGQQIEFRLRDQPANFTLVVDGQLISTFRADSLNAPRFFKADFGTAKLRRIELLSRNDYWGGLAIEPNTSVVATQSTNYRVSVVGDSFTEGTGSEDSQTYCATMAYILRNIDLYQFGFGGSGYINTGGGAGKFIDRIDEATGISPDMLIVAGGINDLAEPFNDFTAAVDSYYAALSLSIDISKVVIIGVWYMQDPTATVIQFNDYLRVKASELGIKFIDPVGDLWVTGTGKIDAKTQEGNSDFYRGADGTHPTQEGHLFLGRKVAEALLQ